MESFPSPQEESLEAIEKRHKEAEDKYYDEKQKSFLENVDPEWNDKELATPDRKDWVQELSGKGQKGTLYENYGTYGINNDKIAFCTKVKDGGGVVYVAPYSPERAQELETLGYKKGGLGVPYSNGDMPFEARNEWSSKFGEQKEMLDRNGLRSVN